jgi:predicted nucleic acid-binding protein
MLAYLDTCVWHRPFDDQIQSRVAGETAAFYRLLAMIEAGTLNLATSDVLALEASQSAAAERQHMVMEALTLARRHIAIDAATRQRAAKLESEGVPAMDALHVACAEAALADWFCTCDDRLIRRLRKLSSVSLRVGNPIELLAEIKP